MNLLSVCKIKLYVLSVIKVFIASLDKGDSVYELSPQQIRIIH